MLILVYAAAIAQAAPDTAPVIESIEIRNLGAGRLDESFVRMHLDTRTGAPFDRAAVSRDVKALLGTGRFTSVDVAAEPLKESVKLVYSFRNRLRLVAPPEVTGSEYYTATKIGDLLELKEGVLVDDQVLGVAARKVVKEYRDNYYPEATLSWEIEEVDHAEGLGKVRVEVKEGRKAYVEDVQFTGNKEMEAGALSRLAGQRSPWNPADWLARWRWFPWWKREYNPDEFEAARMTIRDSYLDKGFLDVAVSEPRAEANDAGNLIVRFDIQEGRTYRLGKITLGGVTLFPESEFLGEREGAVKIRPGDLASFAAIRDSGEAVREYYTSRGYLDTLVRPVMKRDRESGVADIHYELKEGILTKIGNIGIRGNVRTKDKVIRRELLVYPGEIYNESKLRASERRLMNLGYFGSVRAHQAGGEVPDVRDMVVEVEEKRTGQFSMGAGFSSIDQLTGYMEISQGNFDLAGWPTFTGGGQKARLSAQFGKTRRRYELSLVEPWFMDHRVRLGADLYMSEVDYTDYEVERLGGALRLGRALPWNNRVDLTYRLENVRVKNAADTNEYVVVETGDPYSFMRNDKAMESSLRLEVSHDTRNTPFFPSRGNHVMLFGELTGGPLNFDTDIYSVGLLGSQYVPLWFGHVLSAYVRSEVVEAYGQTDDVPISDRLFLGGGRTLRGFEYRDVGPKARRVNAAPDDDYHRPIGGKSLAAGTVEYTLPVHREIKPIRLALFYDIGNVWLDAYEFDFSRLASGAGIGLRFDLAEFPMRFDYAWPLGKDDPYTDTERFSFSITYGQF
jgi:outer membrane protein insertion porin family